MQVTWLSVDPSVPLPPPRSKVTAAAEGVGEDHQRHRVQRGDGGPAHLQDALQRLLIRRGRRMPGETFERRRSFPTSNSPGVTPRLWSSGRLGWTPGVLRGEREVVPGRHRELGRGLCTQEQAGGLHACYQAEKVDQRSDGDLRKEGSAEWGET